MERSLLPKCCSDSGVTRARERTSRIPFSRLIAVTAGSFPLINSYCIFRAGQTVRVAYTAATVFGNSQRNLIVFCDIRRTDLTEAGEEDAADPLRPLPRKTRPSGRESTSIIGALRAFRDSFNCRRGAISLEIIPFQASGPTESFLSLAPDTSANTRYPADTIDLFRQ